MNIKCEVCSEEKKFQIINRTKLSWVIVGGCGCSDTLVQSYNRRFDSRKEAKAFLIGVVKGHSHTQVPRELPSVLNWDTIGQFHFCRSCSEPFVKEEFNLISHQCKHCEVSRLRGIVRTPADRSTDERREREYLKVIKSSWGH